MLGYSLESPREAVLMSTHNIRFSWGDSNKYPQHMFLWRMDKNDPSIIIKYPHQIFMQDTAKNKILSIVKA